MASAPIRPAVDSWFLLDPRRLAQIAEHPGVVRHEMEGVLILRDDIGRFALALQEPSEAVIAIRIVGPHDAAFALSRNNEKWP